MRQIRVTQYGNPEQLRLVELPDPVPAPGQRALRRHGVHAFYGNLIGNPTLNPTELPASIKLTYPVGFDHVPDPARLRQRAREVFDLVVAGSTHQPH